MPHLLPWQTQLADFTQTVRAGTRPEVPEFAPVAVGLLLKLGQWSGLDALRWTRRARGDWPTGTLAAIAPYLPQAEVLNLLKLPDALPRYTWLADLPDLRGLVERIRVLAGEAYALQTLCALPDNCRALLAPMAVELAQQVPNASPQVHEILTHAIRHAHLIDRVLESAEVMFDLLPFADPPTQQTIIEQALERIHEQDFPILPSLWRQIAAVDPDRALANARRDQSPYPKAAALVAVSWHLPPEPRHAVLELWLDACRKVVADGFNLRGNSIPTPLPPTILAATRTLLQQANRHDRAYVLSQLAAKHPECASPALLATATCHPLHRALAWVVVGRRLEALRPPDCPARSYRDRGLKAVTEFQAVSDDLFREQRAWTGWHADVFLGAHWCARAIAQLPAPYIGPELATHLCQ